MHVVFDMDNTLVDAFGREVRPGMRGLLTQLEQEGHRLSLWTSSTRVRALRILREHELRAFFDLYRFREDYDPHDAGVPKDIRAIDGDVLIDDDRAQVAFTNRTGRRGIGPTCAS